MRGAAVTDSQGDLKFEQLFIVVPLVACLLALSVWPEFKVGDPKRWEDVLCIEYVRNNELDVRKVFDQFKYGWTNAIDDDDEAMIVTMVYGLAAGEVSEKDFAEWLRTSAVKAR